MNQGKSGKKIEPHPPTWVVPPYTLAGRTSRTRKPINPRVNLPGHLGTEIKSPRQENIKNFLYNRAALAIIIVVIIAGGMGYLGKNSGNIPTPSYQTAKAEKGTIVSTITASGSILAANSSLINTQASGVVRIVYVKDGDKVNTGDKIAEIDLDLEGKQRAAQSYSSYQNAKNNLDAANNTYYSLRSDMMTKWKNFMDLAQSSQYQNPDLSPRTDQRALPQFISPQDDWLFTEAKYKLQKNVIAQVQTSLNNAWLSYQQTSPTIYAPISGTVTGFSLQPGSVITSQSNSSGGASSQKIANIKTGAFPTVLVNLTEIDIPKVKIGNKATLTFDAFPNKTFTGQVISIDTVGTVSSGVTSYPTVIKLDTEIEGLLPNMSAQANIITEAKSDIITVPSAAVITTDGQTTVRIMRNGQPETVEVEIGIASDSHTQIISGINEGDIIITGQTAPRNTTTRTSNGTASPFGVIGGGGFGGGNAVFRRN